MNITIGVDATNVRQGGGVAHLVEIFRKVNPEEHGILRVVIWSNINTLKSIGDYPWLIKCRSSSFEKGLLRRVFWQKFCLSRAAKAMNCDLLFVPGGNYIGSFRPIVTMSQNMLPFDWYQLSHYGLSIQSLRLLILRLLQSKSFQRADGVIFLTKFARDSVLKIIGPVKGQTPIIGHGLDSRFQMMPRQQLPIKNYGIDNPYRVIYVSIIDQYKHQWHVIEAISMLRSEGFPVVLELVGPSYKPALKRLNKTLAMFDADRSWVTYHGDIPFDSLHHYYAQADLGLFASSCENMPNILLEMMGSGLPIVCSNWGPMPEMLEDSGVYFDPEQPKDIAGALRVMIESPKLRSELAEASYLRSQQYSWKHCAEATFCFFSKIALEKRI